MLFLSRAIVFQIHTRPQQEKEQSQIDHDKTTLSAHRLHVMCHKGFTWSWHCVSDAFFRVTYSDGHAHPIQSKCTTRSTSSGTRTSRRAESAGTCPPPATRNNLPGCWTGRKPRLTYRLSAGDTSQSLVLFGHEQLKTHFLIYYLVSVHAEETKNKKIYNLNAQIKIPLCSATSVLFFLHSDALVATRHWNKAVINVSAMPCWIQRITQMLVI